MDDIISNICRVEGCGCVIRYRAPSAPGLYGVKCPRGHTNSFRVGNSDEEQDSETVTIPHKVGNVIGRLEIVPRGILGRWRSRCFTLHPGPNTIGRHDDSMPCDIEIFDDTSVSRRSVIIDVTVTPQGSLYKLTVVKSANPVLHNGRQVEVGETIYLNYGDCIQLGNTRFNLVE